MNPDTYPKVDLSFSLRPEFAWSSLDPNPKRRDEIALYWHRLSQLLDPKVALTLSGPSPPEVTPPVASPLPNRNYFQRLRGVIGDRPVSYWFTLGVTTPDEPAVSRPFPALDPSIGSYTQGLIVTAPAIDEPTKVPLLSLFSV